MSASIAAHSAAANGATAGVTTPAKATFVVSIGWYNGVPNATPLIDSFGNTWAQIGVTLVGNDANFKSANYICVNGNGGAAHTFTPQFSSAPTGGFGILVLAISGGLTSGIADQTAGGKDTHSDATPFVSPATSATTQADEISIGFTHTFTNTAGPETHSWNGSYTIQDSLTDPAQWTATSGAKSLVATGTQSTSINASGATATDALASIHTLKSAVAAPANVGVQLAKLPPQFQPPSGFIAPASYGAGPRLGNPPALQLFVPRRQSPTQQVLTLAAVQGSFAFTGQAVNLPRARTLAAVQGAYAFTGQAINLPKGRTLAAVQGAYSFTGQAINLPKGRTLTAAQGAFVFGGQAVAFKRTRALAAAQGAFAVTGQAINLPKGRTIPIGQGSFAFTGQAINLPKGRTLAAVQGSFAFTGRAVNLPRAHTLTAASGAFAFTGEPVNFAWVSPGHFILIAGPGAFAFTGQLVALPRTRSISAAQGAFIFAGQAVGFPRGRTLPAVQGTYSFTGQAVNLPKGRTLGAGQGTYTFTGLSVNLPKGRTLTAARGAFAFTGQAATLVFASSGHATLFAGSGFFGFSGQVAGLVWRQAGSGGFASARMATQRASASMTRVVFVGTKFRATCTFQDFSKALADPDAVTFSIGGITNDAIRDSVGVYHVDFTPTEAGRFHWRWAGTGAISAATEGFIEVLPTEE